MKDFILSAFADEAASDIKGQILNMQKNGISGLEIRNANGKNITELSLDEVKEIKKQLSDAGLFTWSIGSPIGKIILDDDFSAHLDVLKRTLEYADVLEAKRLRMFSFFIKDDQNIADCKDQVFENLAKFCEVSKDSGILLCHENEKGIYGDNADRCLEILKQFPSIRQVFDPANFVQCSQDTVEAWKKLKDFVDYVHIKDALPDGSVVPAGKGDGNVKFILDEYYKQGGRNLTLEPHLTNFPGLSKLELDEKRSEVGSYCYGSMEEAFEAATTHLRELF